MRQLSPCLSLVSLAVLWGGSIFCPQAEAAVVLDGTLGPAGRLPGNHVEVTSGVGRQVGRNLFHSFSEFNLAQDEAATFMGPPEIRNILARVTGGSPSSIDGTIHSRIVGANLFFLNPSGVIFGPNASIDVSGAFVVSTADYIKLADGGRFPAAASGDAMLTTASPIAFGFLAQNPAGVTMNQSRLTVAEGQALSIISGDIDMEGGVVSAPGGRVNLVAVRSAGELAGDLTDRAGSFDASAFAIPGDITLRQSAQVTAIGNGSGKVVIRGGKLLLKGIGFGDRSTVTTENRGTVDGGSESAGGIDLRLTSTVDLEFGEISATASGTGVGGSIRIESGASVRVANRSDIFSRTTGAGGGGDIEIATKNLQIVEDSGIATETRGAGAAGDIKVDAEAINLHRGASIRSESIKTATGAGGDISVVAKTLTLVEDCRILALTSSSARGGDVDVRADDISVEGRIIGGRTYNRSEIQASSGYRPLLEHEPLLAGAGGNVRVTAKRLRLGPGGKVITGAYQDGDAGNVEVRADEINIDGGSIGNTAGIVTESRQFVASPFDSRLMKGNAGNLYVETAKLTIDGGGEIATYGLNGLGRAGNVVLRADDITLSGLTSPTSQGYARGGIISYVTSIVERENSGGDISIQAKRIQILEGGNMFSRFEPTNPTSKRDLHAGRGGDFSVVADDITVSGFKAEIVSKLDLYNFVVAKGGSFDLRADRIRIENGGQVGSIVIGLTADDAAQESYAGTMGFRANEVAIRGGSMFSRADQDGASGRLTIDADKLAITEGGTINVIGSASPIPSGIAIVTRETEISSGGSIETIGVLGENLSVTAHERFRMSGGGHITAQTGSYRGKVLFPGAIEIVSADIGLSGAKSGLFALAGHSGVPPEQREIGGDITIRTRRLQVTDRALIAATTSNRGNGGRIKIAGLEEGTFADMVELFGLGSGVLVEAVDTDIPLILDGGDLRIFSHQIVVANDARIAAGTTAGGDGGKLLLVSDELNLSRGIISTSATKSGHGSDAIIETGNLRLSNRARISASSSSPDENAGNAGNVVVHARGSVVLEGGSVIETSATRSAGGDVTITAGRGIQVKQSRITALAGRDGGNITLVAPALWENETIVKQSTPSRVYLLASTLTAESREGQGGNISIDPRFVILNQSRITANAFAGNGGAISIISDFLLRSASPISASSELGLPGAITLTAPDLDLAGTLTPLTVVLVEGESHLPEHCGRKFSHNISSFIVLGRGGLPVEPAGWQPSSGLDLEHDEELPPNRVATAEE